jgi:putative tryptophan/tyrosine transport system substrate-binding protein
VNRRELLLVMGGAMTAARGLRAQQKAMPVIGFLASTPSGPSAANVAAFRQGLSEGGYIEGKNVAIEYRWADGNYNRLPALAADLVGRKVDVIATSGGASAVSAAKNATVTIPIVFASGRPVELGLVASRARPGGNLTGISNFTGELMPKRFELISELVPQASVIALLMNPDGLMTEDTIRNMQAAARVKGRQLSVLKASTEAEIDAAFATLGPTAAGALVLGPDPFLNSRRDQLVALAARHAVPAIYEWRESVAAGGLISYGTNISGVHRQVGAYVGRVLAGEKPTDLPVQTPTRFELVVNLKTAKALGLVVSPSILARATEVIE